MNVLITSVTAYAISWHESKEFSFWASMGKLQFFRWWLRELSLSRHRIVSLHCILRFLFSSPFVRQAEKLIIIDFLWILYSQGLALIQILDGFLGVTGYLAAGLHHAEVFLNKLWHLERLFAILSHTCSSISICDLLCTINHGAEHFDVVIYRLVWIVSMDVDLSVFYIVARDSEYGATDVIVLQQSLDFFLIIVRLVVWVKWVFVLLLQEESMSIDVEQLFWPETRQRVDLFSLGDLIFAVTLINNLL